MKNKRIVLLLIAMLMTISSVASARNVVVPTYYGYGVINSNARCVHPYISAYYPYSVPATYYNGYYNQFATTPVVAAYTAAAAIPQWNGAYWYYQTMPSSNVAAVSCNLNMRSAPGLGNKSKDSNVIGTLHGGEQAYVLARSGNWYLVQSVYAPLRRGYVYGSYLQFYRNYRTTANYAALGYAPAYSPTYWY